MIGMPYNDLAVLIYGICDGIFGAKGLFACCFCSTFIKGVVCSKNVKHKRMVSKHENPRILLLGGALEHQKVTNRLASINSILEQVMPPPFLS